MPDIDDIEMPRVPTALNSRIKSELQTEIDRVNADPVYSNNDLQFAILDTTSYFAFPLTKEQLTDYNALTTQLERITFYMNLFPTNPK